MSYKNQRLRDSARGQPCACCGVEDDTICLAHYTGIRQHSFGKGRGIKGSDIAAAPLCALCHARFDQPKERKSVEMSEEFLYLIVMNLIQAAEAGRLKIDK